MGLIELLLTALMAGVFGYWIGYERGFDECYWLSEEESGD